ncbi:ATP-binding protein [Paraburkholderia kururiensis]|uniref:histidine kinase n=1 Tax=Paraburkholderia kururiensis TaxID=984307 RepID=A0ABZ0WLR7_9BURK|nr:ATP-binding protein [Paraburkholderia kururiensis]WQD78302.1 PAS domain S-box protein [Paraburkholderia kururiensis]
MVLNPGSTRLWRENAGLPYAVAGAVALVVFAIDAFTPLDIAIAVLYVVVVLLVASTGSRRTTTAVAYGCVALTLLAFALSHDEHYSGGAVARCAVSLLAIVTTAMLALRDQANTAILRERLELLDLTHDAIVAHDMNDRITFWNQGAEKLYGWTAAQAIGQPIHELTRTHAAISLEDIRREVLRSGGWQGELQRVRKDGETVMISSRWALWRDLRGQPVAILATNNDITDRKQVEHALRRSEAFLSDAQRLSHTGSIATRLADGAMWWSEETYRIFEVSTDVAPGIEQIVARVHPEDAAAVGEAQHRVLTGEPYVDIQFRLLMPDARVKHVHYVAHLVAQQADAEYVGALMDITERVVAQDALDRSTAELAHATRVTMLGELAASIAHEVTQPLAAIVTAGDAALRWLDRPTPDVAEARQSIEQMTRDAKRSTDVIRRIRGMARKRAPDEAVLDLNMVVRESLDLVRRELESQKVDVETDYSAAPQRVRGDRVQLQQVVVNLMLNAVQAMSGIKPGARRLVVRTRAFDRRHAQVVVEDTGTGICEADFDRLFSAFFTTKEDGMGMGLSICRSIVEAHGGRIWAESREHPGAVMQFVLPLHEEMCHEH